MSLPGEYSNPVQEARDLKDQKVSEAYQQGHDAEIPPSTANNSTNVDIEKAIPTPEPRPSDHSPERGPRDIGRHASPHPPWPLAEALGSVTSETVRA